MKAIKWTLMMTITSRNKIHENTHYRAILINIVSVMLQIHCD